MKKFLISLILEFACLCSVNATGSFVVNSADAISYTDNYIRSTSGQLSVYVVDALDNTSSLTFTCNNQDSIYNVSWYSYKDSISNTSKIKSGFVVKGATSILRNLSYDRGYVVVYTDAEGNESKNYIWLTKYSSIQSAVWNKEAYFCDRLPIQISPVMYYQPLIGYPIAVERSEEVSFGVFEYDGGNKIDTKTEEISADSIMYVDVPTINTPFKITNLDFNTTFTTDTFVTYAVNAFPKIVVADKSANEIDSTSSLETDADGNLVYYFNGSSKEGFRSSGPLTLQIYGNFSPAVTDYTWYFADNKDFANAVEYSHKNMENITDCTILNNKGQHWIKLVVKNAKSDCEYESIGHFHINGSALYIPNAFTPNSSEGDNDEFRVGYISIESFECRIYNQWGRKVYDSNKIDEGWDGTHNGHELPNGVYFYVIKAKGLDGVSYDKKGTINLVRPTN